MPDENFTDVSQDRARALVAAAREQTGRVRAAPGLTPEQQDTVDTIYSLLVDLEDAVTRRDWKSRIQELQSKAKQLSAITAQMRESGDALKEGAQMVSAAAQALGAVTGLLAKASTGGIG